MTTGTITAVAAVLLALGAAAGSAMAQGTADTRTAKQFDDYNSNIKPPAVTYDQGSADAPRTAAQFDDYNSKIKAPSFGYDAAGASAGKNTATEYRQGAAQSLEPSPAMVNQDKR